MIEHYMTGRVKICIARSSCWMPGVEPQVKEFGFYPMAGKQKYPLAVVLTKVDKLKRT